MITLLNNEQALSRAYVLLSPYSDKMRWEFNSHLCHLNLLTKNITKSKTILDVGCGIGILALSLKLLGYDVDGYDKYVFQADTSYTVVDPAGLRKIWDQYGLRITPHDVFDDDQAVKRYDAVISVATLEHQFRPRLFLECLEHSARRGGLIYLATPNVAHILNRIRCFFGRPPLGNLREFFEEDSAFVGHFREYTLEEMILMFDWMNIKIVFAGRMQDKKPKLPRSFREMHVNILRIIACIVPSLGETNVIIGRV